MGVPAAKESLTKEVQSLDSQVGLDDRRTLPANPIINQDFFSKRTIALHYR
jgi:hypothetical protein